jgi:aldehyde:ferredoxin oxidoreductase
MEHDFLFAAPGPALKSLEPLGVLEPVPAMSLEADKVRLFILNQKLWSLYNMLDLCIFVPAPAHTLPLKYLEDLVAAATGWQTSLYELLEAGERGLVMARVFNLREGFTAADDTVPQRLLEPLQNGAAKGTAVDADALAAAVQMYYSFMGWEENTGVPHEGTLRRLGLDWLVPSLQLSKRR